MSHHERDTEAMLREAFDAFNERRFADYGAAFMTSAELVYPQSGSGSRVGVESLRCARPIPPHRSWWCATFMSQGT